MIAQHHSDLPPSSYPAWAKCPHWEGKTAGKEASAGTEQHALLARAFSGENLDNLEDVSNDLLIPVRRAYRGIGDLARDVLGGNPDEIHVEERLEVASLPLAPFGTLDFAAVRGDHLFVLDYKSFTTEREHWEQLAFYAYAFCESHAPASIKRITLAIWYGDTATFSMEETTKRECLAIVSHAIGNRLNRGNLERTANPWCTLCAHCGNCPKAFTIVEQTTALVPSGEQAVACVPLDRLPLILTVCAEAKKRIRAIEDYARDTAIANGGALYNADGTPAYEIKEREVSEIEIQSFYDKTRDLLTPPEVLVSCKLTKESAKALLKGKKRDGKKLMAKEIDAIIAESSAFKRTTPTLIKVRRKEIEQ